MPFREYTVAHRYGEQERHRGRGLEARTVLSLLARGGFWEKESGPEFRDDDEGRDDHLLWDGCALAGIVLNAGGNPRWYDGKPLALLVEIDAEGTRLVRIPAAETLPEIRELPGIKDGKLTV